MSSDESVTGSRLLRVVGAIAISPAEARKMVEGYLDQSRRRNPRDADWQHEDRVANKIIGRYAGIAAMVGGATALAGVIPGVGTAVATAGGAAADTTYCMKLQVDMCMCLACTYRYDLQDADIQQIALLIAASGTLERLGTTTGAQLASEAGVRLLRQYLKGAALTAVKALFKQIGITFTRKAFEKLLPFGVGVAIGSGANLALTRFVGRQAKAWFVLDRSMPDEDEWVPAPGRPGSPAGAAAVSF